MNGEGDLVMQVVLFDPSLCVLHVDVCCVCVCVFCCVCSVCEFVLSSTINWSMGVFSLF